jgi:hypothetical protein
MLLEERLRDKMAGEAWQHVVRVRE